MAGPRRPLETTSADTGVRVDTAESVYADATNGVTRDPVTGVYSYPPGDIRNEPAVRAWLEDAASRPSVVDQLRARRLALAERSTRPVSPFTWWAWLAVVDQLQVRLDGARDSPGDDPLGQSTVVALADVLDAMRRDLRDSRPW